MDTTITTDTTKSDMIDEELIYPLALGSSFGLMIISLILTLIVLLCFKSQKQLKFLVAALIPMAVGALLGNSFFHIIPECFEEAYSNDEDRPSAPSISIFILLGILICYTIEKSFVWCGLGHSHTHNDETIVSNISMGNSF
jgi:zinc transporter ZupT